MNDNRLCAKEINEIRKPVIIQKLTDALLTQTTWYTEFLFIFQFSMRVNKTKNTQILSD